MKHLQRMILCFLIFAVFVPVTAAQEIPIPMPLNKQQRLLTSAIMEPAIKGFFEKPRTGMLGLSFAMNPMFKSGFSQEIGFTEEQFNSIQGRLQERFGVGDGTEPPEALVAFGNLMKQLDERATELAQNDESIDVIPISEEEQAIFRDGFDFVYSKMSDVAQDVFTPEQMAKVAEIEFATFGGIDSPFINIDSMGVLELTDEQKKEIEEFQKETEDEKKEILNDISEFTQKIVKTGKFNLQDGKNFEEKTKKFTQKVSDRMREILTEDQIAKAEQIIKRQKVAMQKMMGGMGAATSWIPGADSWKPGQPILDSFQRDTERKPRFPRAKKVVEEPETPQDPETE